MKWFGRLSGNRVWRLRDGLWDLVLEIGRPGAPAAADDALLRSFLDQARRAPGSESERAFVAICAELFGATPPGWDTARGDTGRRSAFFDSVGPGLRDAARAGRLRVARLEAAPMVFGLDDSPASIALGPASRVPESRVERAAIAETSAFELVDQELQAATLIAAARSGVAFCEECARPRA